MKYVFSLILMLSLFIPSLVLADEIIEAENELYPMDYDGGDSEWIVLDDSSYKISSTIKYFDKAGLPVSSLSLGDNDKVLAKIRYPEDVKKPGEVVSLQLYKTGAAPVENASKNKDETSKLGMGQVPKKENELLYKENGVWRN